MWKNHARRGTTRIVDISARNREERNIANAGADRHINIRTHIRKKKRERGETQKISEGRQAKDFRSLFYRKGHSKHIGRQILVNFSTLQNGGVLVRATLAGTQYNHVIFLGIYIF